MLKIVWLHPPKNKKTKNILEPSFTQKKNHTLHLEKNLTLKILIYDE